jgi:predicted tellurium resistance membrane protein TerC
MIEALLTLFMLILLQAVLGFDNLLYISLESQKAPADKQSMVRKWGIGLAIVLRIGLLFLLIHLVEYFQDPFWSFDNSFAHGSINVHSVIVLVGGAFIIYTAVKEIWHMLSLEHSGGNKDVKPKSTRSVIMWIVIMNIVFSFDSILSAMALTDTFWIMAVAIIASGLLMMWMSDRVSNFLRKNRMYEVLGLFVLFIVGIMLVTEGGHLGHLEFFGNEIVPMSKTTFYFVLAILVIVEIVQSRYQKKIDSMDKAEEDSEKIAISSRGVGTVDKDGKIKEIKFLGLDKIEKPD